MSTERHVSLGRVVAIFVVGVMAGAQGALYVYDTVDDGVSDPLSGGIALVFVAAGIGLIARSFRRARE
jgi:hypothetical protein